MPVPLSLGRPGRPAGELGLRISDNEPARWRFRLVQSIPDDCVERQGRAAPHQRLTDQTSGF